MRDRRGGGAAAAHVDAAERRLDEVGRQARHLEHGQAIGRHVGELDRIVEPGDRQKAADEARGRPHDGDVAENERARRLAALEQPRDDLRADAGGVAHGDREQRRRHRQAGLSMSMKRCASPNSCATCSATAGAP